MRFLYYVLACFFAISSINLSAEEKEDFKDLKLDFYLSNDSTHETLKISTDDHNIGIQLTGIAHHDSILYNSYTDQIVFNVNHEKRAFLLQFYSSIFIFIMVVLIVGIGLFLSYKQFKLNEEIVRNSLKNNSVNIDKGTDTASTLEVNKDGIKMNTAVIGLMILVISLVFFFLYLNFVYKIDFIK
ncbi:MAG: hypothetical protein ACOVO9_04670 [Bacteroidia bacterium]